MIGALRIIESLDVVDTVEDWSDVRSKGRARRRRKQGHKQRVRYVEKPSATVYRWGDCLVMHPVTAAAVRDRIITTASAEISRDELSTQEEGNGQ